MTSSPTPNSLHGTHSLEEEVLCPSQRCFLYTREKERKGKEKSQQERERDGGGGGGGVVPEDKNIRSLKHLRESWMQRKKNSPSVRISCKLSKANEGSEGTVSIRI
jgi:hypothetical protein